MELTELPEKWYVKWDKEIGSFYNMKCNATCYGSSWKHLSSHNRDGISILIANSRTEKSFGGVRSESKKISIELFYKLILNKEIPKKQLKSGWLWD